MKHAKYLRTLLAAATAVACMGGLAACSGQGGSSSNGSGAVAATGEGVTIMEDDVTKVIQSNRSSYGLDEDADWAQALIEAELTPASYRENIINSMADEQLIKSGAEALGITIGEDEIDSHVQNIKKELGIEDDEGWAEALKGAGFTEESYRENITGQLIQQQVSNHFQEEAKVEDKDLLESAQEYMSYYDGAKRSSHILIGVDENADDATKNEAREKAQSILDQINNGADFAELAKENSTDEASAKNGGDVGWDVLNSFVAEYTDALDSLKKGEVSGIVESDYGFHIIKVTDEFNAPEKLTKMSQLPDEFVTTITNMAKQMKANEDYEAWLEEQRKAANITINEIPADAPYNVDLEKYKTDESTDAEDEEAEAATADGDEPEDEDAEEVEIDMDELEDADDIEVEEVDASDAAASASSESAEADGK